VFDLHESKQFKRDKKKLLKQKKNLSNLKPIIEDLLKNKPLREIYLDHPLSGDWRHYRDCHVENDLVLIYKIDKKNKKLILQRIGSHSELFG
jgi:mRNA interferase YafQ